MPVKTFLPGHPGESGCLGAVAIVGGYQHDVEIESAQPHQSPDVIEAHSRSARLPARDHGLNCARALGQFSLS